MTKKSQKLELTWIGKDNRPKLEPRILIEDPEKSYHAQQRVSDNDIFDNRLIFGDNLLALKALEQEFAGMVKCIYIDPPFNTGAAFEHYDDGVEHSIWLDLMYQRLTILNNLLSNDGVLAVHIDDIEHAYLKILLDEIFGRSNFVNNIAVRDSHPSGLKLSSKDRTIIKTKSYMLIYRKSPAISIKPIYAARDEWDIHFNTYVNISSKPLVRKKLREVLIEEGVVESQDKIDSSSLRNKKFKQFCFENRDNIFQSTKEIPEEHREASLKIPNQIYEYISTTGERGFALNGRRLSALSKSIHDIGIDGYIKEEFAKLLCDFWDDVDFNNTQNEGGVKFPASKKPEYLIARVLTLFSGRGDLVLDSFSGSGTTAAVAHKMKRRWIAIELGEHCHTHIIPRLKKVIDGNDLTGVTKILNWAGGGGFRYYKIGPSLITKDAWGNPIINTEFKAEMLAEAMCKIEGFKYAPSEDTYWIHGKSTESDFIYVTTQFMSKDMLTKISDEVGPDRSLLICCSAFRCNPNQFSNLTLKKIPKAVLSKCEWGHDDYSLEIKNLPEVPAMTETVAGGVGASPKTKHRKFGKDKDQQEELFDMGDK